MNKFHLSSNASAGGTGENGMWAGGGRHCPWCYRIYECVWCRIAFLYFVYLFDVTSMSIAV